MAKTIRGTDGIVRAVTRTRFALKLPNGMFYCVTNDKEYPTTCGATRFNKGQRNAYLNHTPSANFVVA